MRLTLFLCEKSIKQSTKDKFARVTVSAVNIKTDIGKKYCALVKRI